MDSGPNSYTSTIQGIILNDGDVIKDGIFPPNNT